MISSGLTPSITAEDSIEEKVESLSQGPQTRQSEEVAQMNQEAWSAVTESSREVINAFFSQFVEGALRHLTQDLWHEMIHAADAIDRGNRNAEGAYRTIGNAFVAPVRLLGGGSGYADGVSDFITRQLGVDTSFTISMAEQMYQRIPLEVLARHALSNPSKISREVKKRLQENMPTIDISEEDKEKLKEISN